MREDKQTETPIGSLQLSLYASSIASLPRQLSAPPKYIFTAKLNNVKWRILHYPTSIFIKLMRAHFIKYICKFLQLIIYLKYNYLIKRKKSMLSESFPLSI